MDSMELVEIVTETLQEYLCAPNAQMEMRSLGNQVFVVVNGVEFVMVVKTTEPERRWRQDRASDLFLEWS